MTVEKTMTKGPIFIFVSMREWLAKKVDSGEYKGLKWIDRDTGLVDVPYKHAKMHNYNEEDDLKLFKDWSEYTGKWKQGWFILCMFSPPPIFEHSSQFFFYRTF